MVFEEEVVLSQINIFKSKEILHVLRINVFQHSLIEAIQNETQSMIAIKIS